MVDAGRDDLDPLGDGVVEALELGRLVVGQGQDGVGAADDGGLGLGPLAVVVGGVLRLHPGQGVERGHQGQLELVLEGVAGKPRQPVVGVDEVGPEGALELEADAGGELVDVLDQVVDRQGGPGTGVDMVDAEPRLDRHHARQPLLPAPGVDVAVDSRPGQGAAQLADVDVHPSTVAGAGLRQRRCVEGEDSDAHVG